MKNRIWATFEFNICKYCETDVFIHEYFQKRKNDDVTVLIGVCTVCGHVIYMRDLTKEEEKDIFFS